MKKLTALLLVLVLICSLSVTAFAAGEQTGTTTISVTVPEASYTIHIPADMTLEYGNTEIQDIGTIYVSDVENPTGSIKVVVKSSGDLTNESNSIPVVYYFNGEQESYSFELPSTGGAALVYTDKADGSSYYTTLKVGAKVPDWTAEPGTYTATLTFAFSFVN